MMLWPHHRFNLLSFGLTTVESQWYAPFREKHVADQSPIGQEVAWIMQLGNVMKHPDPDTLSLADDEGI